MLSKYKNKRRAIQENLYLSICMYFSAILFQMQSTYILIYLGRPSYPGKVFTWKRFISPKRYPASFCRELAKASYSAESCKQSPGITISFYNSWDLAVAE
jgi:hypothetical protein